MRRIDCRDAADRTAPTRHPHRGPVRRSTTPRPRWASSATDATRSSPSSTRPWPAATCGEFLPGVRHPVRGQPRRARSPDRSGRTACSSASPRPAASCHPRGARRSSRRSTPVSTSTRGSISSSATTRSSRRPPPRTAPALIDYRRPPDRMETTVGRKHLPGKRVILTVGTDCAIGKMSVALELVASARRDGADAVMVPTGQTGMMIEGWGVAVDRVISDFTNGTVEWLVEQGEERGDWVIVEGQGSIDHPAYSAVTLGLIHGATPHAMVLVHKPGTDRARLRPPARRVVPDRGARPVHRAARADRRGWSHRRRSWRSRSTRRSIPDDDEARRVIAADRRAETGLPADDPVRFGADRLWPRSASASTRCRGSEPAAHEVLSLALRDPFRIARSDHGAGTSVTTVIVELRDDRFPDLVGVGEGYPDRLLRRDARTRWRRSCRCCWRRSASRTRRGWPPRGRRGDGPGHPRSRGREVRARHRPPRPRRQGRSACRSTRCSGCRPISHRPTSRSASTSRRVVAERARRAADFPALKIKVRRAGRPRHAAGGP